MSSECLDTWSDREGVRGCPGETIGARRNVAGTYHGGCHIGDVTWGVSRWWREVLVVSVSVWYQCLCQCGICVSVVSGVCVCVVSVSVMLCQ